MLSFSDFTTNNSNCAIFFGNLVWGVKLVFGKSYGKATRDLSAHPAEPSTSKHYLGYAENRPLIVNEFELKHPLQYNHFKLTDPGEGSLGPLPEGARPRSPSEDMFPLAQN